MCPNDVENSCPSSNVCVLMMQKNSCPSSNVCVLMMWKTVVKCPNNKCMCLN